MSWWLLLSGGSAAAAVVMFGALAWMWRGESRAPRLICLMYHRFVTDEEYRGLSGRERVYSLPATRLEAQLRRLSELGYRSVTMRETVAFVRGEADLPERSAMITIDDGCRSVLTRAVPVLRALGHRAIVFVTTDPAAPVFDAARPDQARLSDDEIRGLDPDVIEVGSHAVSHRPLTALSDGELDQELSQSRAELERILGRPVRYLAIPGGWYDDRVRAAARRVGYEGVCVSDAGAVQMGHDPLRLRRLNVKGTWGIGAFERSLRPSWIAWRRLRQFCRRLPQRMVGPDAWSRLRPARGSRAALADGKALTR